jgi:UDP-N-acetylglucosamine/UDP-N-acetylgalactosamine diphosphorylase
MAAAMKDSLNNVLDKLHLSSGPNSAAPREPSEEESRILKEKYEKAGQGQVFTFYDSLTGADRGILYDQLASIDPDHINKITDRALNPPKPADNDAEPAVEPLPDSATASVMDSKKEDIDQWYESGLQLIANNKVAVVLMAGGQGTRLGSSAPKGCFNIGLPSEKSLFQIQAERIYRVQQLAQKHHDKEKVVVPWYVMTSGPTRGPTERFFKEHKYFGLDKENVSFFEQGVLPCISNDGKILLESKSKV